MVGVVGGGHARERARGVASPRGSRACVLNNIVVAFAGKRRGFAGVSRSVAENTAVMSTRFFTCSSSRCRARAVATGRPSRPPHARVLRQGHGSVALVRRARVPIPDDNGQGSAEARAGLAGGCSRLRTQASGRVPGRRIRRARVLVAAQARPRADARARTQPGPRDGRPTRRRRRLGRRRRVRGRRVSSSSRRRARAPVPRRDP